MLENVQKFHLDGDPQEYSLMFDYNAVCAAENKTGVNLMSCLSGQGLNANQTRGLLYACLLPKHPLVTLEEAGELLTKGFPVVLANLLAALTGTMEQEESEGDNSSPAGSSASSASTSEAPSPSIP